MFDSFMFNLGIASFEFAVDDVTTVEVILFIFDCSPPMCLLLDTFKLFDDFADDGEFRTTVDGFGLTTHPPVDVAYGKYSKEKISIQNLFFYVKYSKENLTNPTFYSFELIKNATRLYSLL